MGSAKIRHRRRRRAGAAFVVTLIAARAVKPDPRVRISVEDGALKIVDFRAVDVPFTASFVGTVE